MRQAVHTAFLSLALLFAAGTNTIARTPLPNLEDTRPVSLVCVASGLAEADAQALQRAVCAAAAQQISAAGRPAEIVELNTTKPLKSGPMVALRLHVEPVAGAGTLLTLSSQVPGNGRRIPTAAHAAPFDPKGPLTPAVREGLRMILHEHGLL